MSSAMDATATAATMPVSASGKHSRFTMSERNLMLLQEICRKDPESYKEEFLEQFQHYVQTMKLLHLQPAQHRLDLQPLLDSINFLCGLASFYPEGKEFGAHLMAVLRDQASGLDPDVRMSFCKALVALIAKNIVDTMGVMQLFFDLIKVEDKHLRKFVLGAVANLLKRLCTQKKDMKLLGRIQNFVMAKLKDSRTIVVRAAQLVLIDAFRKKYWRDAKTCNAIAESAFHKLPKIQVTAMKFFLGSKKNEEGGEETDSEDELENGEEDGKTLKQVMMAFRVAKKSKKREKDMEKAKRAISKKKKAKKEGRSRECNLLALQLLYDPQEFADRLFGMLETKRVDKFEVRLFRIALVARVVGVHKLQTLGFYSYLQRYLQPKQREVTRILLYAAQACHDLVPPDTVEQLVRAVANNFITDRNSPEAITVGLNAIREIFANCPFAATEELLRDLAAYKTYKNKNVSMAAKGLVALFRQVNPKLLHKKDRGRPVEGADDDDKEYVQFGVPSVREFVPGAECLDEEREETGEMEVDDSDDGSGSDGWVDMPSDDDSEEEEEVLTPAQKAKKGGYAKKKEVEVEEEEEEEEDDEDEECDDEEGEWETDEEGEEGEDEEEEEEDEEMDEDEEEAVEGEGEGEDRPKQSKKLAKKSEKAAIEQGKSAMAPKAKAVHVSTSRILTQEEFKKINTWQIKKQLVGTKRLQKLHNKKLIGNDELKLNDDMEERMERREQGDGLPRLNDIEKFHRKKRQNKAERLAQVEEGREGRGEFGKPKKNGSHVGRTNRELAKKKVYSMVKAKVRGKNRQRSFMEQQASLRKYLLRQAGKKV